MYKGISGVVAALLIGLLGIAGCGGDASISKAEYKQQIEQVCNSGLKKREEILKQVSREYLKRSRHANAKEEAELQAENVRKLMAAYRGTTQELADVSLPENGEKKAEELVKQREDGAAKIEAEPREIAEFTTIFAKAAKIAEGFGADSCAK